MVDKVYYSYCFIRKDLSVAQQIIQLGHATWGASQMFDHREVPHTVLFEVENEHELIKISKVLANRVGHYMFYEPDYDVGYSALVTAALDDSDKRRELFTDYKKYESPS